MMNEYKLKTIKWSILYWIFEIIIQLMLMIILATKTEEEWLWYSVWCSFWCALTAGLMIICIVIFLKGNIEANILKNCSIALFVSRMMCCGIMMVLAIAMFKTMTDSNIAIFLVAFIMDTVGVLLLFIG